MSETTPHDTPEPLTVTNGDVTVTKTVSYVGTNIVAVECRLRSERDSVVDVEVADPLPPGIPRERIVAPRTDGTAPWRIVDDDVVSEISLEPEETRIVAYAAKLDGGRSANLFDGTPRLTVGDQTDDEADGKPEETVNPLTGSGADSHDGFDDAFESAGGNLPKSDGNAGSEVDDDGKVDGGIAADENVDGGVADARTTGVGGGDGCDGDVEKSGSAEADGGEVARSAASGPPADEPLPVGDVDVSEDGPDGSDPEPAAEVGETNSRGTAGGDAVDLDDASDEAVLERVAAAAEEAPAEECARLREALGLDSYAGLDARLRRVQQEVGDVDAYRDALEELLERGNSRERAVEGLREECRGLRASLESVDEDVDDVADRLDRLESRLDEFEASMEALERWQATASEAFGHLATDAVDDAE